MSTTNTTSFLPEDIMQSPSNAQMVYVPVGVFLCLCPSVVGVRLWSRKRNGGVLGADDLTILASLLFALASSGVMLAACYYGYGQHMNSLSHAQQSEAMKYFYLCQVTYKSSINLTKASIVLLYLRIFTGVQWFRWTCIFMLTCVAMYWIGSVTATIFQCIPVARAFDRTIDGHCIENGNFWFANAGFSITTDLIILVLPMPLVYSLQIPRVQKAALIVVFALGIFVVITSCLRVTTIDVQATTPDKTYDISSTMWTIIEMNVGILCACLPQIRPLIVKLCPRLMPTYYYNTSGSAGAGGKRHNSGSSSISKHNNTAATRQHDHETGRWACRRPEDGITLTSIRPKADLDGDGDGGSEECILQCEGRGAARIQRTVQYSIEFSKEAEAPKTERSGSSGL